MNTSPGAPPVVYMDESSNSGQDLLNPDQPVFTLAGVHLSDELATAIVDEVRAQLPPTQGEPKYRSLARSSRGRKTLMRAFGQLPAGSVRSFLIHKRFMVTTKLVDILIEPLMYAMGDNIYANKANLALSNLLHTNGPVHGDAASYNQLLRTFVDWARQRATTDDLYVAVAAYRSSVRDDDFAKAIGLLEFGRHVADVTAAEREAGEHRDSLDPAVPSLYPLCIDFGSSIGPYRLVHDSSRVISRYAELLPRPMLDMTRPGRFLAPPPITKFDFADSKAHPQLQLADWAAGAVRQVANHAAVGGGDRFSEELKSVVPLGNRWDLAGHLVL